MDRTLEMLEDRSVQRINVTTGMRDWWSEQIPRRSTQQSQEESATRRDDSVQSGSQWGSTLPGHGGT